MRGNLLALLTLTYRNDCRPSIGRYNHGLFALWASLGGPRPRPGLGLGARGLARLTGRDGPGECAFKAFLAIVTPQVLRRLNEARELLWAGLVVRGASH